MTSLQTLHVSSDSTTMSALARTLAHVAVIWYVLTVSPTTVQNAHQHMVELGK